ncbi:hypothetical protein ccbrp13_59490 [Ktedonobacteria bacterium brp13]|nr:hypothetical protein ccbrp13_59490 [Ktedonobacteria bacterium brp13]
MTRQFNNQRRNDDHSSFRSPSTRRFDEQRSTHPARPRLNRETVDRAWENGANRTHADYHPRSTGQSGQPPRNNWRNKPNSYQTSEGAQPRDSHNSQRQGPPSIHGRNSFQRYGQNQDDRQPRSHFGAQQRDDRPANGGRPNNRPYGARNTDEQPSRPYSRGPQSGGYQRGGYGASRPGDRNERPRPAGERNERPSYSPYGRSDTNDRREGGYQGQRGGRFERRDNDSRRPNDGPHNRDTRPQQGDRRPYSPSYRPDSDRHARPNPRPTQRFEGDYEQFTPEGGRPERKGDYEQFTPEGGRPERSGNRFEGRPERGGNRFEGRPERGGNRFGGRPERGGNRFEGRPERGGNRFGGRPERGGSRFGGRNDRDERNDRFHPRANGESAQQYGERVHGKPREYQEQNDRHVTPLPDGRVIKGSRPEQRKQARFWTDVNSETNQLVQREDKPKEIVPPPTVTHEESVQTAPFRPTNRPSSAAGRTRRRQSSASEERRAKIKKPRSTGGPRPSQRGFKWPTQ